MFLPNTLILSVPAAKPYLAGLAHLVRTPASQVFVGVLGESAFDGGTETSSIQVPNFPSRVFPLGIGKALLFRRLLRQHGIGTIHAVGAEAVVLATQLQKFCGCRVVADGLPETTEALSKPLLKALMRCAVVIAHKQHHTDALKKLSASKVVSCAPAWFPAIPPMARPEAHPYRVGIVTSPRAPEELFLYLRALNEAFHADIVFDVFNAVDAETVSAAARQAHIGLERVHLHLHSPMHQPALLDQCHALAIGNLGENAFVFPLVTYSLSRGVVVLLPELYADSAAFVRTNEAGIVAEALNPSVMRKSTVQLHQAMSVGFYEYELIHQRMHDAVLAETRAAYRSVYGA